jgi:hypothetical protein
VAAEVIAVCRHPDLTPASAVNRIHRCGAGRGQQAGDEGDASGDEVGAGAPSSDLDADRPDA